MLIEVLKCMRATSKEQCGLTKKLENMQKSIKLLSAFALFTWLAHQPSPSLDNMLSLFVHVQLYTTSFFWS